MHVQYHLGAPDKFAKRDAREMVAAKPYRTEFERDRDRVLYSKEFRRLSGKTQVFVSSSDNVRTRLTHTLEVSQIARTTARNLSLDEILTEAIALAHDVGHTPFGHVGEQTLNSIMCGCDKLAEFQLEMKNKDKGFKHNWQGIRVLSELEQRYNSFGLNLTNYTLWGVVNHTRDSWGDCKNKGEGDGQCYSKLNPQDCVGLRDLGFYDKYKGSLLADSVSPAWSFEADVVKIADEIAQRHHDIEDALYMKIIDRDELLNEIDERFSNHFDYEDEKLFTELMSKRELVFFLPQMSKFIVHFLNKNLILNSSSNLNKFIKDNSISSKEDFAQKYIGINYCDINSLISYETEFEKNEKNFQEFLRNRILNSFDAQRMDGKGKFVIRRLFKAYLTNPRQLHDSTITYVFKMYDPEMVSNLNVESKQLGDMRNSIDSVSYRQDKNFQIALLRGICDHLAGMTDSFAIDEFKRLYG